MIPEAGVSVVDVAIIGAGPYGLSIAAHLSALGVDFRIFGTPMESWKTQMPPGMSLKSDGSSSDLSDPGGALTLKTYCEQHGFEHHDTRKPVPLATFIGYGMAFQKQFVQVEDKRVVAVEKSGRGYALNLDTGETITARRVVVAAGIAQFAYVPGFLRHLPPEVFTHSGSHGPIDGFRGKQVAILGAGASAIDLAALIHQQGAQVSVVARQAAIEFHAPPSHRPIWRRIRSPGSGIGAGWQLRIFADMPQAFHALPEAMRLHKVRTLLGPSTGWFMKDQIEGKVSLLTGRSPQHVEFKDGRVHLHNQTRVGTQEKIVVDHLVAATGYRIDLRRLPFLTAALLPEIRALEHAPVLSANFETSAPGLYFVGPASMNSFGPVVRFVFGADFTAKRVSRHLASVLARRPLPAERPLANNLARQEPSPS
jgi:cation diffusion facilitator CzcD-associated flavoprotein CzcO